MIEDTNFEPHLSEMLSSKNNFILLTRRLVLFFKNLYYHYISHFVHKNLVETCLILLCKCLCIPLILLLDCKWRWKRPHFQQ